MYRNNETKRMVAAMQYCDRHVLPHDLDTWTVGFFHDGTLRIDDGKLLLEDQQVEKTDWLVCNFVDGNEVLKVVRNEDFVVKFTREHP